MDENWIGRYLFWGELDFSKDELVGVINMGYVGEKGRLYVVNDKNGYDYRL